MPKKRATIRVVGIVQGVMYRQNARRKAASLGLLGWIKNEPDGSVQIIAEGSKNEITKFLEWCKRGTPWAEVEEVLCDWGEITGEFKSFEIK
ncbi:MAG: acylphosphatase [Candidatus Sungbacteria bacterium]|nr:acylphosphatase [Candidatus Sungbacteria bacterium]